jgi:hypothetical protein
LCLHECAFLGNTALNGMKAKGMIVIGKDGVWSLAK